jgi:hypothetical protein
VLIAKGEYIFVHQHDGQNWSDLNVAPQKRANVRN